MEPYVKDMRGREIYPGDRVVWASSKVHHIQRPHHQWVVTQLNLGTVTKVQGKRIRVHNDEENRAVWLSRLDRVLNFEPKIF